MSDIFISYAREDYDAAQRLAEALGDRGWSVWWDRTILAGEHFEEEIRVALQEARCVVVLWSPHSILSDWVKDEARIGKENKNLVPVQIETVDIPLGFGQIQTGSLTDWDGDPQDPAFKCLAGAVSAMVPKPATPDGPRSPLTQPVLPDPKPPEPPPAEPPPPEPAPDDQAVGWARLVTTKTGLATLLATLFVVNLAETALETWARLGSTWRDPTTLAVKWLEGGFSFEFHDLTNNLAVYGYSTSYFIVFPVLVLGVAVALALRPEIAPFRVFSLALVIDYLLSLPFFLFFPVLERWAHPDSGAMLLSDKWTSDLIELIRPISGLDNCFPSTHTSMTVIVILVSFLYRTRFRFTILPLGLTIILSTLVLGIHWLADIIAGVAVGVLSVFLARRLDELLSRDKSPSGTGRTELVTGRIIASRHLPGLASKVTLSCVLILAFCPPPAAAQHELSFIGVALDEETEQADQKLRLYLRDSADVVFVLPESEGGEGRDRGEYERVIEALLDWSSEDGPPFLARTTPYVFVAAEMLGASLQVLAIYKSNTTQATTYNAYFVVNRERFGSEPTLAQLAKYLRDTDAAGEPARFIYHNRFSTSSYFLPSLYFRANNIFHKDHAVGTSKGISTAIRVEKVGDSSTNLVKKVAAREYELAAVWDGTKDKFAEGKPYYSEYGSKVAFIQLSIALPNDLLVAPASLDPSITERIDKALGEMPDNHIEIGDFKSWKIRTSDEARAALKALGELRWLARGRQPPVTVDLRIEGAPLDARVVESVRQAVRLSGTELVLYDEDYHRQKDVVWSLRPIHDEALVLNTEIQGTGVDAQEFQISYGTLEDLTRRVGALIHSRMHRIRYVWPYQENPPAVIRDVDFTIPSGKEVMVRRIHWDDPEKADYEFRGEKEFSVEIEDADYHRFQLASNPEFVLDPMSDVSYRVVLVRPDRESTIFKALTVTFIILLVLAAAAAVFFDLRRR